MSNRKKTIVLVGLMGAGKSSVGWRLAKRLEMDFHDIDRVIEEREGLSISEIFEYRGEEYFRKVEKDIIREFLEGEPCVLAPGGGAFMNQTTRRLIKKRGVSIWLNAPFEVLLERVSRKRTRPLLEKGDKAEILRQLYEERSPVYAKADIVVDSDDGPHHRVVSKMLDALGKPYIRPKTRKQQDG
ncbi:MAG: shikimate kinase [Hyphomicrobiales bacterium]|nr:shikimate kinase [Rickettsiales bacterium]MCP5362296.1 shikimate kinase [Hyphomicrobiales bacterium]